MTYQEPDDFYYVLILYVKPYNLNFMSFLFHVTDLFNIGLIEHALWDREIRDAQRKILDVPLAPLKHC